MLWRRIIRDRWFGDDSRVVGSACMRMLLDPEAELSWPNAVLREMERVGKAIESGALSDADLSDWVGSWLAQAEQREVLWLRRHLGLA